MSLVLYNTMSGRKEPFVPLEEGWARIYVCGPTVYDHSHIGHARAAIVFDVLVRYLKSLDVQVTYVRNFTDLDDKIINRAQEEGLPYLELAQRFIDAYHRDMDALGVLRPDAEPRATEYVEYMIEDVKALIDKGYAYRIGGDVYYEVARFPEYGRLSGRNLEDMKAGARVEVDERKRSPLDFALWKESKPGEPFWPSPWGQGRPGWHLECSVMSNNLLGADFDIHGGGHDLVFPHHENEIAQAVPLGRSFARYWLHNGFVRIDQQKMSKSLKNFFTVREVLERHRPEVLRLFLLAKHYRGPVDFSDEGLKETGRGLERAYRTLLEANELGVRAGDRPVDGPAREALEQFRAAMDDDLNTARAIGHLFEVIREINRLLDEGRGGQPDKPAIGAWLTALEAMGRVLGVLAGDPAEYLNAAQEAALADSALTPEAIDQMVQSRIAARQRKDWAEADRIRDELKAQGVILEDAGGQTTWRIAS